MQFSFILEYTWVCHTLNEYFEKQIKTIKSWHWCCWQHDYCDRSSILMTSFYSSLTSTICHQHIPSLTSVTNIDVSIRMNNIILRLLFWDILFWWNFWGIGDRFDDHLNSVTENLKTSLILIHQHHDVINTVVSILTEHLWKCCRQKYQCCHQIDDSPTPNVTNFVTSFVMNDLTNFIEIMLAM